MRINNARNDINDRNWHNISKYFQLFPEFIQNSIENLEVSRINKK